MPLRGVLYVHWLNQNRTLIYSSVPMNETTTSPRTVVIPLKSVPRPVNRDMLIDIEKSIGQSPLTKDDRVQLRLCGEPSTSIDQLIIGNQTLYEQEAFHSAARWLLDKQDAQTGCWFIRVPRTFGHQHRYHLRMPWCSAMAQGEIVCFLPLSRIIHRCLSRTRRSSSVAVRSSLRSDERFPTPIRPSSSRPTTLVIECDSSLLQRSLSLVRRIPLGQACPRSVRPQRMPLHVNRPSGHVFRRSSTASLSFDR